MSELMRRELQLEKLSARVAELERALDRYGDYSRHGDAIRRVLARSEVKR